MKGRVSAGTQRPYPLTMICAVYRVPRSSVYAAGAPTGPPARASKPGPKTDPRDGEVVEAIRAVLAACPFHGEGYRKVRAPPGAAEWQPGPRRHDHHRPPRCDVGDRCDALLHRARRLVLVLRGHRSQSR